MKKAVVLSSGGLDSTTCMALAVRDYGKKNVVSVSIFYGQKHKKELECARAVSRYYDIPHYEFDLSSIMAYSNCSLLEGSTQQIEHKSYSEQVEKNADGRVNTYVPFRNGLMLSVCASLAQGLFEDEECDIIIGVHSDDAAGNAYADCSVEFVDTMSRGISIGTYGKVKVLAPFYKNNKAGIVKKGLELGAPYNLTWSCYEGGDRPCGECGTCRDRAAAFAANGAEDPIISGKSH
ncbi:MAG: 7-cyano-7-deazaguanine synthase QueC [Treponema sp.]|nr:7-cyano-7-deazaguanine synthase QueC [Treponema sp.]